MDDKKFEKNQIFKTNSGAEIGKRMVEYFKKYTIPEMQHCNASKTQHHNANNTMSNDVYSSNTIKLDPTKIFDGNLPLVFNK